MSKVYRSFDELAELTQKKADRRVGEGRRARKPHRRNEPRRDRQEEERSFNARVRRLREAEQRVEEEEAELEARERQLEVDEDSIKDRIARLEEKRRTYTLFQRHVEDERRTQEARSARLEAKAKKLDSWRFRLRGRERDLSRRAKEYAAREERLRAEVRRAARQLEQAEETERTLTTRPRTGDEERDALAVERDRLARENRSLEDRAAKMRRKIAAQTAKITGHRATIAEQAAEFAVLSASVASARPLVIGSPTVRGWLAEGPLRGRFSPPTDCVVLGSGPWSAEEFHEHLHVQGHTAYETGDHEAEIMIVGRGGWTELEIDEQLEAREGQTLRVYSQEMFFLAIATGRDPFDSDRALLRAFGKGHPALEYLMETSLLWPAVTVAVLDEIDFSEFESTGYVSETPLRSLGYRAGASGPSQVRRRRILRRAFGEDLPFVESKEYMRQWGSNGSRRRLARIAHHLAWLARIRQKDPSMARAIADWEGDLAWLKKTFYRRWMRFEWPKVRV